MRFRFFNPKRYFQIQPPVMYVPAVLCLLGTLFFLAASNRQLIWVFSDRWSVQYLLLTPFMHGGVFHFLFNMLALNFIGAQMVLPMIYKKRYLYLLVIGAMTGTIVNNLLSDAPAIGISAAIFAVLGCSLYTHWNVQMKFLFIHDILKLRPFKLCYLAGFLALLDVAGIIFDWNFYAHHAHLGGFASGLLFGYWIYRRPPWPRSRKKFRVYH